MRFRESLIMYFELKGQRLVASIKGLKSGKTPDDLRREGMDEETIQAALECI